MVDARNSLNNLTEEKEKELKREIQIAMKEKKWSFDPLKGEVKTYDTKEDFDMDMNKGFVPIDRPPPKNCKSCYGRGYVGRNITLNYYVPCGCMFDTKKKGK
jgi:hypothetical protein